MTDIRFVPSDASRAASDPRVSPMAGVQRLVQACLVVTGCLAVGACPPDFLRRVASCALSAHGGTSSKAPSCTAVRESVDCLERELRRCQRPMAADSPVSEAELRQVLARLQTYRQQLQVLCAFVRERPGQCSFRNPAVARRLQTCTDLTRGLNSQLLSGTDLSCRALARGVRCWLQVAADCPDLVPEASVLEFQNSYQQLQQTCPEQTTEETAEQTSEQTTQQTTMQTTELTTEQRTEQTTGQTTVQTTEETTEQTTEQTTVQTTGQTTEQTTEQTTYESRQPTTAGGQGEGTTEGLQGEWLQGEGTQGEGTQGEEACPVDYVKRVHQCPAHLDAITRLTSSQNWERCVLGRAAIACYDRYFRLCADKEEVARLMTWINLDGARGELRHLCPE